MFIFKQMLLSCALVLSWLTISPAFAAPELMYTLPVEAGRIRVAGKDPFIYLRGLNQYMERILYHSGYVRDPEPGERLCAEMTRIQVGILSRKRYDCTGADAIQSFQNLISTIGNLGLPVTYADLLEIGAKVFVKKNAREFAQALKRSELPLQVPPRFLAILDLTEKLERLEQDISRGVWDRERLREILILGSDRSTQLSDLDRVSVGTVLNAAFGAKPGLFRATDFVEVASLFHEHYKPLYLWWPAPESDEPTN